MIKVISVSIFFLTLISAAQNKETIEWINNNSILIEDANSDSQLIDFEEKIPVKFSNAKIFGFGEASHNTKEFFTIKSKFFKHLVKTQGIRVFIMEESYQAEAGINEWISGGKGNIKTIAENFNIGFWRSKEVVDLLQWMRDFNLDKPKDDQIRFYGMDIQNGKNLNREIRDFVNGYRIPIDEDILKIADSCSNKNIEYDKPTNWAKIQVPKLKKLKETILDYISRINLSEEKERSIIRSINYLIKYTEYVSNTKGFRERNEFRDLKMFENVKWIIENESENGKAFIWAHNEHINKKEMYSAGSDIINLGRRLKDYYKEDFYSVGFDFATGKIKGYVTDEKNGNHWKTYHIKKPFRRTYARTLNLVDKNIYFIDLAKVVEKEPAEFFSKENEYLLIGGGGYQPKPLYKIKISKIYSESYDALIFVKKISVPDYELSEL
ncbi:erythromycin esterase family protein [Gramella sp. KN1008]|uniref:erythromycin esterase family protein n=1 Tax=Gramella sp. KN1008 TaxID=2529298 RepID=UPI00103B6551|nr:erythromycin esterase family protein [Gramella sp. KN1008]TBW29952.1 erythromycin esterase family protein [Gramella sp. KN1008]